MSLNTQSQDATTLARQRSDEAVAVCDAYYAFLCNPRQDGQPPKRPTAEQRDEAWERWMEEGGFGGWGNPGPLHTLWDYQQNAGLRLIRDSQERRAAQLIGQCLRREHPDSMFEYASGEGSWGPKDVDQCCRKDGCQCYVPRFDSIKSRALHEQEKAAVELKRAAERGLPADPNSAIVNAEALLAAEIKPFTSLAKYFDSILQKLLRWDRDDPLLRPLLSPLAPPFRFFQALHEDVEYNAECILQQGTSSQYARAEAILSRLVKIVDALECLERDTFDGTLQHKYDTEELKCQNTLWRAAVDGIRGAEAWNYQG
ncbi:hypothetical protein VNI00_019212 [Paramarasmius palmivorus]|uniref:Uncharacterized protein n=1 Tax=Paramarasmius palmivorus TaxID=297713 RepID=A0AAW0AQF2_9AGAR